MKKVFIIICIFLCCSCGRDYSNGSRYGIITKLSLKGVIFESWEGEALMSLPFDQSNVVQPEKFEFNVDPSCVDKIKNALHSGKRVELVYRQWLIPPLTICSDYVIIDIK